MTVRAVPAYRRSACALLIEPESLPAWVELKSSKLDVDAAANHAKEFPEYRFYEASEGRIQSDFRSRAVVIGDVAVIPIHNAIDYRPSIWSDYGYESSSLAIRQDFRQFLNDETISKIIFDIDSPGGVYVGTPELAKDIFDSRSRKETIAIANPMAASGALWIGAAAGKFYALGSGDVGSIGCLVLHSDWSQFYTSMGVVNTIIRSPDGKADFNSLEALKEETRSYYQQQVSDIAQEFQAAIAKFRNVSSSGTKSAIRVVQDTMGNGRMMKASDAVSAGLIDGVVNSLEDVLGKKVKSAKRTKLSPRLEIARLAGLRQKQNAPQTP